MFTVFMPDWSLKTLFKNNPNIEINQLIDDYMFITDGKFSKNDLKFIKKLGIDLELLGYKKSA